MMPGNPFDPVIGLEVHAQIRTRSKMFCSCSAEYSGAEPNTHVCAVCGGMPGSLPVINRRAVEATVLTGLALGCTIAPYSKFDRKNYTYPDLPKGYQISQYDFPLCTAGSVLFEVDGERQECRVVRVHLEEDTGKSIHVSEAGGDTSLVDYNRSGIPLMEIVGEPDLTSPASAREYFATLRQILMYLDVCDGNLQDGSMRADVNVSIRGSGSEFGTKIEIKNLNSFRAVERALEYEIERQRRVLASGGVLDQETRGWAEKDERTVPQRSKEYAHDYRYFPEPDLPPLILSRNWVKSMQDTLPELPSTRRERFEREYGLSAYTSRVLTDDKPLGDYFQKAVRSTPNLESARIANFLTQDFSRLLKESERAVETLALSPERLGGLVTLLETGQISGKIAKQVLEEIFTSGEDPEAVVDRDGLRQISDRKSIEALVNSVLLANEELVEQYRRGKTRVDQALAGKVMGASRGRANPVLVQGVLREKLADL